LKRNKLLLGLIGLVVGFTAGFIFTKDLNSREPAIAAGKEGSRTMGGGAGGDVGSQQKMMAVVSETIEKAKNNPNNFEAQIEAASLFDQIGRTGDAIEYLKKAYELNPAESAKNNIPGYIGQWYSEEKNYKEAEMWLRRALQHEPGDKRVLTELGVTFIERDPPDVGKGLQYVQSALKIDPKDPHALFHLVQAYLVKKDAAGAEQALNQMKQADPRNQTIKSLESSVEALKAGRPVTIPSH
jgi:tetratricopeptide (TPR) repeat protein